MEKGKVGKRRISKKLEMDATHQKKVNEMTKECFHVDLSLQRIIRTIIIRNMAVINKTKQKYCNSGSESSRSIHEVIIGNTPTCSCADFLKYSAIVL